MIHGSPVSVLGFWSSPRLIAPAPEAVGYRHGRDDERTGEAGGPLSLSGPTSQHA